MPVHVSGLSPGSRIGACPLEPVGPGVLGVADGVSPAVVEVVIVLEVVEVQAVHRVGLDGRIARIGRGGGRGRRRGPAPHGGRALGHARGRLRRGLRIGLTVTGLGLAVRPGVPTVHGDRDVHVVGDGGQWHTGVNGDIDLGTVPVVGDRGRRQAGVVVGDGTRG